LVNSGHFFASERIPGVSSLAAARLLSIDLIFSISEAIGYDDGLTRTSKEVPRR
jgi:hypothetical protein